MAIHVGCCGFQRSRKDYFQSFALIEVQQTFYKPPRLETARRWREDEAPSGFIFTLKAWQLVTHPAGSPTYRKAGIDIPAEARERYGYFRPTAEVFAAWERTREIATLLAAPLVVFQCPASFKPTPIHKENLRVFFSEVERDDLIFAWEPRGNWDDGEVADLCQQLQLVHCVDPFIRKPVTSGIAYFRLHGIGGYRYKFTQADLEQLRDWCHPFEQVYVLFNNISMWEDGMRFRQLVDKR